MQNAQADGMHILKRVEFEFANYHYQFVLNPEEYTQDEPNRATFTQTKGGAWVDDFGGGIPSIYFKGTTGFKNSTSNPTSGFLKFRELRDLIRAYYGKISPGVTVPSKLEMVFHNYTDADHWVVEPQTFKLYRSISRPTLYQYEIQLLCLRPAHEPDYRYIDNSNLLAEIKRLGG